MTPNNVTALDAAMTLPFHLVPHPRRANACYRSATPL